jgi:uncharacterized protein (DUF2249 family)
MVYPRMDKRKQVTLDVRESIRRGADPFGTIMQAVARLKENEDLRLIAPFKPTPLIALLGQRGFGHQAKETGGGDWEVLFSRSPEGTSADKLANAVETKGTGVEEVEVDARGLEPPQPLVKILEAVEALPAEGRLLARTDRRPMHLYAQLEERGWTGKTEEQEDGSFVTYVCRQ